MADTKTKLPVPTPSHVPAPQNPMPPALPVRPIPSALPLYRGGLFAHRRARNDIRNLELGTARAEATTQYIQANEAAEAALQSAELQHARRRNLPIIAEAERAQIEGQLDAARHDRDMRRIEQTRALQLEGLQTAKIVLGVQGEVIAAQSQTDAAQYARAEQRLDQEQQLRDRAYQQQLEPKRWRQVALDLEAQITEGEGRLAALRRAEEETRARHARQAEIEEENHRTELMRRDLAQFDLIAAMKERIDAARKKTEPPPVDPAPEFTRHWQTEQRVRANRSPAETRIAQIYDLARTERRNLTAEEIEEIDALADTAESAESEVRRRAASGL